MRTMLFLGFDPNLDRNKQFLRDLRSLIILDADKRRKLLEAVFEVLDIKSDNARKERIERLAKETKVSLPEIYSALESCSFLVEHLAKDECKEDKSTDLGEDLRELTGITEAETNRFVEVVENIKHDAVDRYKVQRMKKAFEAGVLPSLQSCGATVEIRALIEDRYHFGMDPDKYKPTITGYAPVISINLSVDSGVLNEFIFQATPEEVRFLIGKLRATLTEVEAFENYISKKRKKT